MQTIAEAKKFLRLNWEDGCDCPCCGQWVKKYERKLNTGMCLFMISLYKLSIHSNSEYHRASDILKFFDHTKSLDYSVLKWWKLIEEQHNDDDAKRTSGLWKLTDVGRNFVRNSKNVPSHVLIYDNKIVGFSDELTNIAKALGKNFNYEELINK